MKKYRFVVMGLATLATMTAMMVGAVSMSSAHVASTVDTGAPSEPDRCTLPSETPVQPTDPPVTASADPVVVGTADVLVLARTSSGRAANVPIRRAAPGDTIVLTFDTKTGKYVKDESSAHFDGAGSHQIVFRNTPGAGFSWDVYVKLPDGKFCAPVVTLPDGTNAVQRPLIGPAPAGFTTGVGFAGPIEGKVVIKWVQTR